VAGWGADPASAARSDEVGAALDAIDAALRDLDLVPPPEARAQFRAYLETLLLWRRSVSLTGAATPGAIAHDHIVDSLPVARLVRPGMRVGDVGSGAGFPGVPVAILCPAAAVALIEPRRKRANFLRDVVRQARLGNVEVVEDRVEALVTTLPGSFDLVVCRAFGALEVFLRLVLPLLAPGGAAVAMKGPRGVGEAAAAEVPGYGGPDVVRYTLPSGAEHLLLVYRRR